MNRYSRLSHEVREWEIWLRTFKKVSWFFCIAKQALAGQLNFLHTFCSRAGGLWVLEEINVSIIAYTLRRLFTSLWPDVDRCWCKSQCARMLPFYHRIQHSYEWHRRIFLFFNTTISLYENLGKTSMQNMDNISSYPSLLSNFQCFRADAKKGSAGSKPNTRTIEILNLKLSWMHHKFADGIQ